MTPRTRREFLAEVGKGMIASSVGMAMAAELGLAVPVEADEVSVGLDLGDMEPLVRLMQETPIEKLLPTLVAQIKSGMDLKRLATAAALANARTFGGEDYVGFHTMMAMAPAVHMSSELPEAQRPLPIFKVLYRNTNRIWEHGGRASEVLKHVDAAAIPAERGGEALREMVRKMDVTSAEAMFAALAKTSPDAALNHLLTEVEDGVDVHRVVLPYRAWDMLGLIGKEHAHTLLRQSVRFCVKAETYLQSAKRFEPRQVLAKTLDDHHLLGRDVGTRSVDDAWIDHMATAIFEATPPQAAELAGAALADGIAPDCVGEAICLAANQLILRDIGRTANDEVAGKPMGSVHGDSIGVHACDSANAWRNLAKAANPRNTFSCLILGAYQAALDRVERGGDFLHWQPLPLPRHVAEIKATDARELLDQLDAAVRGNMQAHAAAAVHRYGQLSHPARPVFDLLLKYAVSEDGSLHAEKFYRTVSEEFATTRSAFRWRHLVALARVTASEYGRPAAGYAQARELLNL